jgi:NAD dependent epimerase/dehydratase
MKGCKVLVTGAGGFIGSHLVETLATRGAEVRALLHYNAAGGLANGRFVDESLRASIEWVYGDLLDAELMARVGRGREIVFHLGALIAIPHSYSAPRSFLNVNAVGTLNVLEAARGGEARRVVHVSTSEVYGSAQRVPMDETHPLKAQSPYAATKIAAEKLVESYHAAFDLPTVIVRPFNTYGPRQSARAVIPTVIGQALDAAPRIVLGATAPVRDMTFVADTVNGLIAAAETAGLEGGTYNLGTGRGYGIGDIAQRILDLVGVSAEIVLDPQRLRPPASEVDRLISDNAAFRAATGWTPRTGLEDGLAATLDFFRHHPGLLPATGYAT